MNKLDLGKVTESKRGHFRWINQIFRNSITNRFIMSSSLAINNFKTWRND